MVARLYARLQRHGYLQRDCLRMVNNDRNIFAASLLVLGESDAVVTGVTRSFASSLAQIGLALDRAPGAEPFGIHIVIGRGQTVFIADTAVHERPTGPMLARFAEATAAVARRMGQEPRVAFLSYSNFGDPAGSITEVLREAVHILDERREVALSPDMARRYPFSRLTGPANVLIMPGLHAANIAAKLLKELGGGRVIGPLLVGMAAPVQIAPMTASAGDLMTLAVLAASGAVI